MKTLLCPIDFSNTARITLHYAALLAQERDAKLVLVVSNPVIEKMPAGEWSRKEVIDQSLEEWQDWVTRTLQVKCEVKKEVINSCKQLCVLSDEYDLMILGLTRDRHGAINNYSGFDLLRIIRETLAPVLIVPAKYNYSKIKRLLYAYDYHDDVHPPLQQIKWLADWFEAEVTFISILQRELSAHEEDRINLAEHHINKQWSPGKIKFESLTYHHVSRCLEHYLSLWEANDLLVLSVNHTNVVEKIWHKSVVKQLLKYGAHPYVVLHR